MLCACFVNVLVNALRMFGECGGHFLADIFWRTFVGGHFLADFVWRAFGKGPKALTKACGKGQGWPRRCQTLCECFVNALWMLCACFVDAL